MQFVRKAALVLVVPLFTLFLFALAIDFGITKVVTHPAKIKQIISNSGIYNSVVAGLLDEAKQVSSSEGDVPLSNSLVRNAASQAITPTFLKQNTETFIDSIYAWLDGKTVNPDFRIDLTDVKTNFADKVSQNLAQQLSILPACGVAPLSFDAFNANCLPKGVTAASAAAQVKTDLLSGKGFLDHPVITADSVKTLPLFCGESPQAGDFQCSPANAPQPFFTEHNDLPKQYQLAKKTPIILATITLLIALAIIFLSSSRRQGFKRVGIALITVGIFTLIAAYGLDQGVKKALPQIKMNNVVLQEKVKVLTKAVSKEVENTYWIMGAAYVVVGAASIAGTMFLFKGSRPKKDSASPKSPADDSPSDPAPRPAPHPRPKKRVLIQ